jgi:cytochrome b subunit of formate dehydrogenase
MNDTTKRFPRTMHEAFNTDCDPISGPYGKQPFWPVVVIIFVILISGIVVFWSRV